MGLTGTVPGPEAREPNRPHGALLSESASCSSRLNECTPCVWNKRTFPNSVTAHLSEP